MLITPPDDEHILESTTCPFCAAITGQVKAGISDGNQRYKCRTCQHRYVAAPRRRGYGDDIRQEAQTLHASGMGVREIGRHLGINPQTIVNWLRPERPPKSEKVSLPPAPSLVPIDKDITEEKGSTLYSDKRRPTITDVAREAGVSTATVSNYLNKKGHMGEETRGRIAVAIEKIHFTPSALVRAIQRRQTRIIGVLLFGIYELDENPGRSLAQPLLAGINRAADKAGYNVLLYTGYPHRLDNNPSLEFLDGHTDGLLWVAPALSEPALERVVKAGLPTVAALTRHVPEGAGWVNADNFQGIQDIVAHLVAQGHRRIAYAGPIYTSNFRDRQEGYRRALAANGLSWDSVLEFCQEDWSLLPYAETLDTWLGLPSPPTAILTANDGMAELILEMLQQRGVRVPDDVSVTGFDDILDARYIGGGLTTIHQPFRQIGETTVEQLIAIIQGKAGEECHTTLPAPLIVRMTTAPAKT